MLLLISLCPFPPALISNAEASPRKNILVLNSYHKGLSWTDNVVRGIESTLRNRGKDINLFYEDMDTKRYDEEQYLDDLFELYTYKFNKIHIDLVIVTDNNALNFVSRHHAALFPGTPVIFAE